jgi:hypothetical protein
MDPKREREWHARVVQCFACEEKARALRKANETNVKFDGLFAVVD